MVPIALLATAFAAPPAAAAYGATHLLVPAPGDADEPVRLRCTAELAAPTSARSRGLTTQIVAAARPFASLEVDLLLHHQAAIGRGTEADTGGAGRALYVVWSAGTVATGIEAHAGGADGTNGSRLSAGGGPFVTWNRAPWRLSAHVAVAGRWLRDDASTTGGVEFGLAADTELNPMLSVIAEGSGEADFDGGWRWRAVVGPKLRVGAIEAILGASFHRDAEWQAGVLLAVAAVLGRDDFDGDGLPDRVDGCPARAGPSTARGCPFEDRDQDGTLDKLDACPSRAGTAANAGCPET